MTGKKNKSEKKKEKTKQKRHAYRQCDLISRHSFECSERECDADRIFIMIIDYFRTQSTYTHSNIFPA